MSTATATDVIPMVIGAEVWTPASGGSSWSLIESSHRDQRLRPVAGVRPHHADNLLGHVLAEQEIQTAVSISDDEWATREGCAADAVGGALLIPSFDGKQLTAVLWLWLGTATCAAEIWGGQAGQFTLQLERVLSPNLDRWQRISQHVHFPMGSGLPGRAWRSATPILESDLRTAATFLRSSAATSEHLTSGVAIPIIRDTQLRGVINLIASEFATIGAAFEIWMPQGSGSDVSFGLYQGHYQADSPLAGTAERVRHRPGEDIIGKAWAMRRPTIIADLESDGGSRGSLAQAAGAHCWCALPIIVGDQVRAIALFAW